MGPLTGVTVLDLTRLLPGPYCAWLLRSWGARVIKVEDPEVGDYLREAQPTWFEALNAGAESLALDLKHPRGREALLRLAAGADLVLESFRPGVLERLGMGLEALHGANPRLALVSLSGFPSDSAVARRAGHDVTYLARSGLLSLMGEIPPVQLADLTGGLTAAAAGLAAVLGARATGRGSHVETSLFDAVSALGVTLGAEARAGLEPSRPQMLLGGALPCYSIYETADGGRVALGALEAKFWRAFCAAVDRPGWADRGLDPALRPEVAALFRSQPLARWAEVAAAGDFCLEPVLGVGEAARAHTYCQPALFDGQRPSAVGDAPDRGADSTHILSMAGYSEQEILAMRAERVTKA
jgi:crotonobetainyl-CoA:carnitine CoA-transferase CaiB-like acyl-CoA transferase